MKDCHEKDLQQDQFLSPEHKQDELSESSRNHGESEGSFIKNLNLSIDVGSLKQSDSIPEIEEIEVTYDIFQTPKKNLVSPKTAEVKEILKLNECPHPILSLQASPDDAYDTLNKEVKQRRNRINSEDQISMKSSIKFRNSSKENSDNSIKKPLQIITSSSKKESKNSL
tara:strand:- start:420 stop:926 length:507 start_codon:yes stop_codon:yes gene_type:complete